MKPTRVRSREAFERAARLIPGGVNSPARAFGAVGGRPPFIARGEGPRIYDIDGNQYLDYIGSWGPLILGHCHPRVVQVVEEAVRRGAAFGAPTEAEPEMAELQREGAASRWADCRTLAAALEVVHSATLVHDDTIDQALTRRGLKTVSAVWNSKIAVLVGDFLFAQSAYLAAQLQSVRIMEILSETVMAMSTGELRQYAASQSPSLDESDYFQRIKGKTASLFAMCCEGAAIVSHQSPEQIAALRAYGLNLGLAFQIADDVLDFSGTEDVLGKPAGSDLRQGTITLPTMLFAESLPKSSPRLANILAGRDLIHHAVGGEAFALTTPLITTSSGQKMSKSAGNAPWLDPTQTPPYDYYQYWRNTEDADVGRFLRMFTFVPLEQIAEFFILFQTMGPGFVERAEAVGAGLRVRGGDEVP